MTRKVTLPFLLSLLILFSALISYAGEKEENKMPDAITPVKAAEEDEANTDMPEKRIQIKEGSGVTKSVEKMVGDTYVFYPERRVLKSKYDTGSKFSKSLRLSAKYLEGSYLIYDCEDLHWGCVSVQDSELCANKREESFRLAHTNLRCIPLKDFETNAECEVKQLELMGRSNPIRLCQGPDS